MSGWLFVVIFNAVLRSASSYGLGACPRIGYMPNFNISLVIQIFIQSSYFTTYLIQFTGHWYEIERSFYVMELISSCVSVDLEQNRPGQLDVYVKSRSRV